MPNIEELLDGISQIVAERKDGEDYFTTRDLTSEQCNFSLVEGDPQVPIASKMV